jgi:L-ribulose-5-phosphate 3-epimerase
MRPLQIVPSTTSHKLEALLPTLAVFARLGWHDLDLNLNHMIERGVDADAVLRALDANGQRVPIASGGWCDFFDEGADADRTLASVQQQVQLTRRFGADRLRLFFGRLPIERYSDEAADRCARHLRRVADLHSDVVFVIENHDGASSRPEVCRDILQAVARPNVRLTFDPINFEHRGVATMDALPVLAPLVAHVHLKGYARGTFCAFGEGEVDLVPAVRLLIAGGYRGGFTVEYEGAADRTLHLFQSVRRAKAAIAALVEATTGNPWPVRT